MSGFFFFLALDQRTFIVESLLPTQVRIEVDA